MIPARPVGLGRRNSAVQWRQCAPCRPIRQIGRRPAVEKPRFLRPDFCALHGSVTNCFTRENLLAFLRQRAIVTA